MFFRTYALARGVPLPKLATVSVRWLAILRQLCRSGLTDEWALSLEKDGAARLSTYHGKGRSILLVYPPDEDAGFVSIWNENGGKHAGVCIGWDMVHEHAIEGNTNTDGSAEGNGVYYKERERTSDYVYGYGLPYYPHDKAVTPDPAWSGKSLAE